MDIDGEMRIFLAGATGFVGTGIIAHLLNQYQSVRIRACYRNSGPIIQDDRIEYIRADLRSAEDIRRAVSGCDIAIMSATANTGGAGAFTAHPLGQVTDNTIMFVRLLDAFQMEGVKRILWIGSATLYQEFDGLIKEQELDFNKDPHPSHAGVGWVMRFAEKLCQFWQNHSELQIVNIRASNIFGPYARFNPETSNFIPALIRKAVDRMDPFEVWGTPEITRDVLFIDDFVRAVIMLLKSKKVESGCFNVGSEIKTTVGNVVGWALKYAGHSPNEIRYITDRPTTIPFRALDCSRVACAVGWRPEYSVEEGVRLTTEWWIKNKYWWTK